MWCDVVDEFYVGGFELWYCVWCRCFDQIDLVCQQCIGVCQGFWYWYQYDFVGFWNLFCVLVIGIFGEFGEFVWYQFGQFEWFGVGGLVGEFVLIFVEFFILCWVGYQELQYLIGEEGIDCFGCDFYGGIVDFGVVGD